MGIKKIQFGLIEFETTLSIKLMWNKNRPVKLKTFLWQMNLDGLPTNSWCKVMGYPKIERPKTTNLSYLHHMWYA